MARRTKEEVRVARLISRICNSCMSGYQINIMDMHYLTDAGEAAAKMNKSDAEIEAAILAARDQHATKT